MPMEIATNNTYRVTRPLPLTGKTLYPSAAQVTWAAFLNC